MDHGLWLLSEEDFSYCWSSTDTLLESIKTILEEVFTALAWITRSQDSFPME